VRVLIVDDEAPAREYLQSLLRGFPQIEVVGEAGDGLTALNLVDSEQPDVLFLDIRMPGLDGLEVAQQLSLRESSPRIVFVTAYDEHALEAFESEAVDYLVKPCTTKRLKKAIQKLERPVSSQNVAGAVRKLGQKSLRKLALLHEVKKVRFMIAWDEIIFLTSRNEKTYVATDRGELRAMETLGVLAEVLPDTFCRSHRSYVVNLDRVEQIQPWGNGAYNLVLRGVKETIPLSRGYAKNFKDAVNWV
jgi:two-component system response regulator LytT